MYVAARCHSVAYRTVALVTLPPTLRADLDSTFCAGIHHSKMALNNPGLLINLVAVAVFTTSAVAFLFLTFRVGTAPDPRGPWSCRLPESWRPRLILGAGLASPRHLRDEESINDRLAGPEGLADH